MKAIISTTYDDMYLWNLPLVTYLWNKLNVDVICFMPRMDSVLYNGELAFTHKDKKVVEKFALINNAIVDSVGDNKLTLCFFDAPEHKQATYAQCSRLYGACLDLPEDEVLITGDVDMLMFRLPEMKEGGFSIFGSDLVPDKQYPMCYISAKVRDWRNAFELDGKSYQQCLDELMKDRDSISMRSDFWALDQEIAYNKINLTQGIHYIPRTNGQNQFATHRLDRDDSFMLDRMNTEVYDYHANRPPYEENNFQKILTVLKFFYPEESFEWLVKYQSSYVNLLQI